MRVLSMQGKAVLDILRSNGVYHADVSKARERAPYSEDIEQLNGRVPIWCWAYPCMDFITMCTGEILEYLRCEMSLSQDNCWDNFYMLEVEVSDNELKVGKHHNGCCWSKVFGELTADMLMAVYTLRDVDGDMGYYYKVITPVWKRSDNCIIECELNCLAMHNMEDTYIWPWFEYGFWGNCVECGRSTQMHYWGRHLCSIKCVNNQLRKYVNACAVTGVDALSIQRKFMGADDNDMKDGVHAFVKGISGVKGLLSKCN